MKRRSDLTTEHLLSAFVGMESTTRSSNWTTWNYRSWTEARAVCRPDRRAGVRKQRRPRTYIRILQALSCEKVTSSSPCTRRELFGSYTINFPHPLIGRETFTLGLTNGITFPRLLCRTFGFLHERGDAPQGLIRGRPTTTSSCLPPDAVVNPRCASMTICAPQVLDLIEIWRSSASDSGQRGRRSCGHAMHTALVYGCCVTRRCGKRHPVGGDSGRDLRAEPLPGRRFRLLIAACDLAPLIRRSLFFEQSFSSARACVPAVRIDFVDS